MEWTKLITLDNQFQADLLTDALGKRDIPFLVREYKDTAYDGLFVTQKGWGTIMVDPAHLGEAKTIAEELFILDEIGHSPRHRLAEEAESEQGAQKMDQIKSLEAALENEHRDYQAILLVVENSPVVLIRWKATEGRPVVMVSGNVIQFGYTPEELLSGMVPFAAMIHPEDLDRVTREVQENSASGVDRFQQEYRLITKNGEVRWVDDRTLVERNNAGQIIFFQGIVLDITERKLAEEALKESNEKLQALLLASPLAIIALDPEMNVTQWNPAAEQMFGWQECEVVGKFLPYIPEENLDEHRALHERLLRGETFTNVETLRRKKDGSPINITISAAPLYNSRGQITGIMGLNTDITKRKRAEEKLLKNENLLKSIFRATPAGIGVVNNRIFQTVNDRICEMTGYTRKELINRNARILYPSDADYEYVGTEKYRQIRESGTGMVETRWQCKDGRIIDVLMSSTPINPLDLSLGVTFTALDITLRKKAEEERTRISAQLIQAQKMESVGRLAGGVAHDFNNMLGVILGQTELGLLGVSTTEPIYKTLKEIQKAAQRSAELTQQLLAFARKQTVAPKILDLNDTVAGMLKMLQRLIGEDISLRWKPGTGLWSVKVDPSQIDQILANLCVNARDAITGVGQVTIETENTELDKAYCFGHPEFLCGEYVALAVRDDGCGMSNEILDHLFEPFFTTKEPGKGTGLGMATVYGIVKQNNGFINVYSHPGKGSTFKIYLPRFTGEPIDHLIESASETLGAQGETVLLVEDEVFLLKMGQTMLERLGYTVLAANKPSEALRQAEAYDGEIQLVITDVVMPEMNGLDLANLLSALKPGIKRLFISGYTADIIDQSGVLDEGVNFLPKPFSMKELAIKVRETLGKV